MSEPTKVKYHILIERREWRPKVRQEWKQVANSGNAQDNGPVYAYVPVDSEEIDTVKVLEMELAELDVKQAALVLLGVKP